MAATPAVAAIWATVAGLPPGKRERRQLLALQAFIDDSGSEPTSPVFVLAGFSLPAERWGDFAADWAAAINAPPRIAHFKSNEAYGLKGEFDGWGHTDREKKIDALCDVIVAHRPQRYSARLYNADYQARIRKIPARNRFQPLETPYFLLFYEAVVLAMVLNSMVSGHYEPIEFFFDCQGRVGRKARDWWPEFKAGQQRANPDIARYIGSEPQFKDDIEFTPLQAADLCAGLIARETRPESILTPPTDRLHRLITQVPGCDRHITLDELSGMRDSMLMRASETEKREPGSLKQHVGFNTKKAKRKKPDG